MSNKVAYGRERILSKLRVSDISAEKIYFGPTISAVIIHWVNTTCNVSLLLYQPFFANHDIYIFVLWISGCVYLKCMIKSGVSVDLCAPTTDGHSLSRGCRAVGPISDKIQNIDLRVRQSGHKFYIPPPPRLIRQNITKRHWVVGCNCKSR